jgi:hypothetical protein
VNSVSAWRAGLVAIVLLLAWRIAAVNLLDYGAEGRPRIAPPGATRADDSRLAVEALRRNPAEAVAILVLAQWHEANARAEAARKAYEAALMLAPLDREVLAISSAFFLGSGDIARALVLLDRLSTNYPYTHDRVFPVLAQLLASHRDAATWQALAGRSPIWIGKFVATACTYRGLDPGVLTPLLARGAQSVARPEAACVVERLRQAERWDEAYQVWLNTLPREHLADVGFVFNGGFEFAPSGQGFDWRLASPERDQGSTADVRAADGSSGRRALRVSYSGKRQSGTPASQFLALPQGRYRLGGQARSEALTSVRGVNWTVRCVGAEPGAVLGRSEAFMGTSEWRRFEFDFSVPPGCRGQILQLEAVGLGEGVVYLSGVAWFDDIAARRVQ